MSKGRGRGRSGRAAAPPGGPPGIRIAGEIDYQAEEPLALAEAVRLEGDVVVNMAALAFADGQCTAMIADAARTMAASRAFGLTRA